MALEPVPMGRPTSRRAGREAGRGRRRPTRIVDEFAARCRVQGAKCRRAARAGDPPEVILKEAQRHDLILLGIETFFRYEAQGSPCNTLDHVLHAPPRPVVAVPEKLADGDTVVIGYDGSRQAAQTLAAYARPGSLSRSRTSSSPSTRTTRKPSAWRSYAADYLALHGATVKVRAMETRARPGPILLDHTDQLKAQLLVMGAFGHSMLREFVFGSTTRTVLRGSKVPVMLFH